MDIYSTLRPDHITGLLQTTKNAVRVLSPDDFGSAFAEICAWDGYAPTPLHGLQGLASRLGIDRIDYKHEGPRFGLGSFKALGGSYAAQHVLSRVLSQQLEQPVSLLDIRNGEHAQAVGEITLVSATDGNHGRSLAWGCQRFGARCRIYIHAEVSENRARAMRDLGADVVRIDGNYDASVALARQEAEDNGWFVVSDTSWPGYTDAPRDVMAGYGVMTREACAALALPPTHVFLQGGVGGLAASVSAFVHQYWPKAPPRIIVVEPARAACLFESARAKKPVTVEITQETIMAGLSCGEPSGLAWEILAEQVSDFLTIADELVGPTVRLLARPIENDPVIEAGESAVAGLAALIAVRQDAEFSAELDLNAGSRVLLFGSEGVTDPEIFAAIMAGSDHG
ncbi:MAG: diaminopropionate ammonia-lyase [Alphaproteobacteria bacterium]|nr:diaminopropionate ammonia-lyase [Alphaproteobacteria bacterium]